MTDTEKYLERIGDGVEHLPNLPTTLHKVLEVCDDPDPSASDINRVISLDPVLAAQVLKLVNSAYYSLPNKIVSLTRAIVMLGTNTVKNLALSLTVLGTFKGKGVNIASGLHANQYWLHSLCVGVTSKVLARIHGVSRPDQEEYFIAGLLHDLGKIPISRELPREMKAAVDKARQQERCLFQVEDELLGLDHAVVGAMVMQKWQLADVLHNVLLYHHRPLESPEEHRLMVVLVSLGNLYANIYQVGDAGDHFPSIPDTTALLDHVQIPWDTFMGLEDIVHEEISKAQVFLRAAE